MSPLPCASHNTHTDTETEQTQPQHTLVSHSLSLGRALSLSQLRAQWFVLRSVCFSRFESFSVALLGSVALWSLPGCLRQTCLLAKMVCLACLVVAFVTVVGNQMNLAALLTRLSTGQTAGWQAGWQLRRPCPCPCQLTQMVIDSLFPLNTLQDFFCCTLRKVKK